jgi:hypothetical protein
MDGSLFQIKPVLEGLVTGGSNSHWNAATTTMMGAAVVRHGSLRSRAWGGSCSLCLGLGMGHIPCRGRFGLVLARLDPEGRS